MRTAEGEASLHGNNLVLEIGDLDKEFSRYESTQNFNLVDVGAFLLAGPLGIAVTKGYDYASVLKSSAGHTTIRTLISQWKVEHGIAAGAGRRARDSGKPPRDEGRISIWSMTPTRT